MNSAAPRSIIDSFPALQLLEGQRDAEVASMDGELVRLCRQLRVDNDGKPRFSVEGPQDWDSFSREGAALGDLVCDIAAMPAASRIGLRAKALSLHALLDDGGGELQDDASAPEMLAWSLIQDILADH